MALLSGVNNNNNNNNNNCFVGKARRKRPLGRPRRRWVDGIKMDLRKIGWGVWSGFNWFRTGIAGGLL
jgi:hypothetical protein